MKVRCGGWWGVGGIKTERDTSWCMRERERERVITLTQNREQAERIGKVSLARCLVDTFPLSPVNNQHASNASLSDI